jgi:hypothetical protein
VLALLCAYDAFERARADRIRSRPGPAERPDKQKRQQTQRKE